MPLRNEIRTANGGADAMNRTHTSLILAYLFILLFFGAMAVMPADAGQFAYIYLFRTVIALATAVVSLATAWRIMHDRADRGEPMVTYSVGYLFVVTLFALSEVLSRLIWVPWYLLHDLGHTEQAAHYVQRPKIWYWSLVSTGVFVAAALLFLHTILGEFWRLWLIIGICTFATTAAVWFLVQLLT